MRSRVRIFCSTIKAKPSLYTYRVREDVATQRIHVQRNAEVQQNQREPNDGHGQSSVAVSVVEEREYRDILVGIFWCLQLVLEVVGQGDIIPPRDPLNQLS